MSAECRSCGAKIFWVDTRKGKSMPMDFEPSDDGTFILEDKGPGKNPLAHFVPESDRISEPRRYVCHYSTCPDAISWRKATGK